MPYSKPTLSPFFSANKATHLVIGFMGEVGSAIYRILYDHNPETVAGIDGNSDEGIRDSAGVDERIKPLDILHICIPYFVDHKFKRIVKEYQNEFKPKITIIHSTVPVGTSRALSAIHSPIRGIHPNLEEGIRKFPKFLGGEQASLVADCFRRAGLKVILFDKPETTEALKLFDTEYYRACIEFAHRVKKFCDKNKLNFHEVYTIANLTYNEGYTELGHKEFVRPVLQPIMTKIGGHCVMQNKELIND